MSRIVAKRKLAENIIEIVIQNNGLVSDYKTGLYLNVRADKNDKAFPLMIMNTHPLTGGVSLLVHNITASRKKVASLSVGDELEIIGGLSGTPVDIKKAGTVLCVAGGVGIAPMLPIARAIKSAGNKVNIILGASSEKYVVLEEEMKLIASELVVMTDDGSCGLKGTVTDAMKYFLNREKTDQIIASGPFKMIKHTCILTNRYNIPFWSGMHSVSIAGNGTEGIFNVSICPNMKNICVDGDNFNAFYPNFDVLFEQMGQKISDDYDGNQKIYNRTVALY